MHEGLELRTAALNSLRRASNPDQITDRRSGLIFRAGYLDTETQSGWLDITSGT